MSLISLPIFLDTQVSQPGAVDGGNCDAFYLNMNDQEIANNGRVMNYIEQGFAGDLRSYADVCSVLYRLNDPGVPDIFSSPVLDPAPWYRGDRPESADFLGLYLTDIDPQPIPARDVSRLSTRYGGAALGPPRFTERVINFTGYLVARGEAGREYGKRWLSTALALGQQDICNPGSLTYRNSCPPDDGSHDEIGMWSAYDVGLTTGPAYTDMPTPILTQVTFSVTAGNPYLFRESATCADAQNLQTDPSPGGFVCIPFADWMCGPPSDVICCSLTPPASGILGAVVTINAPSVVSDVLVGTYQNCPPDTINDAPEGLIIIPNLIGKMVIDSSRHKIRYTPPGGSEVDGTPYIAPTSWPIQWAEVFPEDDVNCMCVAAAHPCSGGYDATVQIDFRLREV
jgi:hypothetical protein